MYSTLYTIIVAHCLAALLNATHTQEQQFNPSNCVIAWDLHGVLVQESLWDISKQAWSIFNNAHNRWELLKLFPLLIYEAYKLNNQCSSGEIILDQLIDEHVALEPHRNEILTMINLQVPIEGSVAILKELNQAGYQNVLASNIGPESLTMMQQKYPAIFSLFKGEFIPKNSFLNQETNLPFAKPCTQYFDAFRQMLKDKFQIHQENSVIFIDDKKENTEAAERSKQNIISIRFESPEQLRKELCTLGILKEQCAASLVFLTHDGMI